MPTSGLAWSIGRAGTDLLHILTSGLMGLALYYAFQKGKYLRLILTYLMVVILHGSWNFFSLWAGFYSFIIPIGSAPAGPTLTVSSRIPAFISPIGLGVLVLGYAGTFVLAQRQPPPVSGNCIPTRGQHRYPCLPARQRVIPTNYPWVKERLNRRHKRSTQAHKARI